MKIIINLKNNKCLQKIYKIIILDQQNNIILEEYTFNSLVVFLHKNEVYKIIAFDNDICLKTIIYTNNNLPNIITLNFCEMKYHLITINLKDLSYEGLPINGKVRIKWKRNKL